MKATDLMIGDYVRYTGSGYGDVKNGDIIKVESVLGRYIGVGNNAMADDELFEPIPLDSEIMNKFGFVCSYDDYHQWYIETNHSNLWLEQSRTEPHTYFMRVFNGIKVRYVHELQHALRLCGIEKTIEL